jgi:GSCFA family
MTLRPPQSHPYTDLPPQAFWRSGVVTTDRTGFPGLYVPKWPITPATRIATAGSCFAQHSARHLRAAGCDVLDAEPPPAAMPQALAARFGYGLYSGRFGNIYSTRQLRELLAELVRGVPDPDLVWTTGGRFYDALRPAVEPDGLATAVEVLAHRRYHLARTAAMLRQAEVLILTLGLTEIWLDRHSGRALPSCPGVIAGQFDPDQHHLHQQTHAEVLGDLHQILAQLQGFRPGLRLLLTVSPVPLTATASGAHVLAASSQAKATLRAAAGEFCAAEPKADYVPIYELLTHPAMGSSWFAPNLRDVTAEGVARVMQFFLAAHGLGAAPKSASVPPQTSNPPSHCDDLLLDAFRPMGDRG